LISFYLVAESILSTNRIMSSRADYSFLLLEEV
jgi:hypothetical protein